LTAANERFSHAITFGFAVTVFSMLTDLISAGIGDPVTLTVLDIKSSRAVYRYD
jgi:hypothetical protein